MNPIQTSFHSFQPPPHYPIPPIHHQQQQQQPSHSNQFKPFQSQQPQPQHHHHQQQQHHQHQHHHQAVYQQQQQLHHHHLQSNPFHHQAPRTHNFQFNRSHSLHPPHHQFLINPPTIPSSQSSLPPTFSAYLQQQQQQHQQQQQQLLRSPSIHQPRSPTSSNHSSYQNSNHHQQQPQPPPPQPHHQTPFNQYSKPELKTPITPTHHSNLTVPTLNTPQLITPPLSIISNGTRKKLKIRLPLEFTPDHQLSLDESRIRSKWKRQPISIKVDLLNLKTHQSDHAFQSTSKDEWPGRLGNRLPDSIDVYLPGKEVWDDYRAEILDEKLTELGYHSVQQDENLAHLDLRLRLEAYLSDHPESDLQIPTIPGIFPFALPPSPLSPIPKPLMSFTAPIITPRGHSSTMSIALPGGTPNQYLASHRSPTFGPLSPLSEPIGPGLKPTAPVFKPTGTLIPTAPVFQPTWAPAPAPVPISIRPRGSISPHRMLLSPTLMIVGEEEEEEGGGECKEELKREVEEGEIVTDSEPERNLESEEEDEEEEEEEDRADESMMMRNQMKEDYYSGSDSVEEQVMNEHNHLMRSSISSQALRQISFKPIISDTQRPEMKTRSSGEEEDNIPLAKLKDRRFSNQLHHLDHPSQSSLPTGLQIHQDQRSEYTNPSDEDELESSRNDRKPSSASLPTHRSTRSHTFGINSFSISGRSSMTAGDGMPHNWINGVEDEDDIISNPSDEALDLTQNEDSHMYRTNAETTKTTMVDDEEVSKPNLNAFAAEFKPNFTFSSMIPHLGSLSKQIDEDDEHQLIGSPGRGIKRQKTQQEVWIEEEEVPLMPSFSGSSTFRKFFSSQSGEVFQQDLIENDTSKPYQPTPPVRMEEEVSFERPGKDNMRTFKFPHNKTSNVSSSTKHPNPMTSPLSNSKPTRVEYLQPLQQSVSLPPPFSLPELPAVLAVSTSDVPSGSIRMNEEDPTFQHYKTLPHNLGSVMIPNSPLLHDRLLPIMRDQPITPKAQRLRPSSSFDDDSSIEHHSRSSSPSPSRLNQARSFELIPTQVTCSQDSMISLTHLKQQKIEWSQIGNGNGNVGNIGGEEIVKIGSSASKKRGEIPKFLDHDQEPDGSRRGAESRERIEKLSIGPKILVEEKSSGTEEMRFLDAAGARTIRISNRVHLDDDDDAEGEEEEEEEEEEEDMSISSEEDEGDEEHASMRSSTNYLNKLLKKKFEELRNDLSGLHSLKVDFDSLKRDALLEEMHKRMEMVIEESHRKEKGKELEKILEAIREVKSEEEIEMMMKKLSEAVKPQIYQLIDLTSDKSETAGLIVQELKPSLEGLISKCLGSIVEKTKEKTDPESLVSFKVGEEVIELIQQLDLKSLNFYQDLSQQIGSSTHELSELMKSEMRHEFLEIKEKEIQELRIQKNELESGLLKARSDHGRVRSERAVEKEKMMEEKVKVERELEELKKKKRLDEMEIERFRKHEDEELEQRRLMGEEKERMGREIEELKGLVKRLESRCEGFEGKEMEWQNQRISQTEEIAELKIKNRMIESENKSIERRLELSQSGYEKIQEMRNSDLNRYQLKEDEIRNELRMKESEYKTKIKDSELEVREVLEAKASLEGEIRSLEGRNHKLDEQISGLRDMSAAKQQSLATVNQRLYESERKSKEVESLRTEVSRLKNENQRLISVEGNLRSVEEEKIRLEEEIKEVQRETEMVKEELEKMYESVAKELEEVHEEKVRLSEEVKLMKIEKEKVESEKVKEKEKWIRFEAPSSYLDESKEMKKCFPTPPLQSYDFIKSNIPLSNSIHAPKPQSSIRPQGTLSQSQEIVYSSRGRYLNEEEESNDEGTVKSFGVGVGVGVGNRNLRSVSPAASRTSSRAIMDQEGWWSVE